MILGRVCVRKLWVPAMPSLILQGSVYAILPQDLQFLS